MSTQPLNPADYFTLLMDHEIRGSGLAGNYCALVLELAGAANVVAIEQRCADFGRRFPLSVARLARQGRRYAWLPTKEQALPFTVERLPGGLADQAAHRRVVAIVNRAGSVETSAPFELHLLQAVDGSLLVLRWFHPATDAKGVELLLHHLFADSPADSPTNSQARQPQQPSPVDRLIGQWGWWRKWVLARRAVRNIRVLDRLATVLPVEAARAETSAVPAGPEQISLGLKLVRYDSAQTAEILSNARRQAGMTGTTLYLIGCMMRAIEATGGTAVTGSGDAYCVPYAANLRRRKALTPIFGNQVSFLFAQAGRELVGSRQRLFAHLREQHKAAVRDRLDQAMLPLMQAGSWLPQEKYARIVRQSPQGRERNSFWFSYTGEMEPRPETIAGCPVQGAYQLSPATAPPGLGLLASLFQGRLTLSYNYTDPLLDRDWVERLSAAVSAELLDSGDDPVNA